jgi:4-hydroxy-tetrahydrodipicolinate synthase
MDAKRNGKVTEKQMQGVYVILVTPFDEQSRVDEDSLRSLVEFNLKAGVHGIGVALGSEVMKLSESERALVTRIVVDQVRGRVPVVINTSGAGTDLAVFYSQTAQDNGADALMILPPTWMSPGPAEIREYFKAISDAVHIPIFIQDAGATPVSAELSRQIAEEGENVRYVKVESAPLPQKVGDVVAYAGDLLTVFGGAGGNHFIEEMRLGAVGTMPSCSQPEAFVEVWDLFQSGNEPAARETFDRTIAPVNRLVNQAPAAFYHINKEILRQRGVIRTAKVRGPVPPLDEQIRRELQTVIDRLYAG